MSKSIAIDSYVLDTLMPDLVGHDRRPAAFLVFLFPWRQSAGGRAPCVASLRDIAEGTGLSRRAVQDSLTKLHRPKLIGVARATLTAVPEYTVHRPWARKPRLRGT